MISAIEIGWVAGFLEGEGSFTGWTGVKAAQKQLEPLERLQALFGGSLSRHGNDMHIWQLYGARARGLMMTLYSLMSPRRKEQIRKQLHFWKARRPQKISPDSVEDVKLRIARGESISSIAAYYSVSRPTITYWLRK